MNSQYVVGIFETEEDIVGATEETRGTGYGIYDTYAPYAVHGLPEAMGLKPSKLTWACLVFALAGFSVAVLGQFWINGIDWAVNVGGRPFNSLPAYLPVMFECIVLAGGVGVTITMLARNGLYPGKRERLIHPDVTNHRFALALERRDASFDLNEITAIWSRYHVAEIMELPEAVS
ncbi:MAG: DUF3341 domain-containing protein [Candidatus Latescibacteria bacterium]|nr:DUF3341 domain-containing protein [Candidatus Latescibacterota bacterium]